MKKLILILVLALPLSLLAQDNAKITSALGTGDIETLSSYFDTNVEITILTNSGNYNKAKATQLTEYFFKAYKPSKFNSKHQGNSKGNGSQYILGSLSTSAKTFRVFVLTGESDGKTIIQQLQIEEE